MIRIVIAEDQELLLGIIGSLLNLEDDMEVVGLASKGEEVLTLAEELLPDICIMDMETLEKDELGGTLNQLGCKVMVLTTFAETGNFQQVVDADVRGFLLKDSSSEELTGAVRSIMAGMRIYSPALMENPPHDKKEADGVETQSANDQTVPEGKPIDTVRSYLMNFKDKMKLPAG